MQICLSNTDQFSKYIRIDEMKNTHISSNKVHSTWKKYIRYRRVDISLNVQ